MVGTPRWKTRSGAWRVDQFRRRICLRARMRAALGIAFENALRQTVRGGAGRLAERRINVITGQDRCQSGAGASALRRRALGRLDHPRRRYQRQNSRQIILTRSGIDTQTLRAPDNGGAHPRAIVRGTNRSLQ